MGKFNRFAYHPTGISCLFFSVIVATSACAHRKWQPQSSSANAGRKRQQTLRLGDVHDDPGIDGTFLSPELKPSELTWSEIVQNSDVHRGYFNQYYLASEGRLFLELKPGVGEFLYVSSLARGVGSNALGLDRGMLGDEHIVHFRRSGNRLILVESNLKFRAEQGSAAEQQAVKESFAASALWSFEIVAENNGNILFDVSSFALRDARRVAETLGQPGGNSYAVDMSRSYIDHEACRSFPKNTVMQGAVTLTGKSQDKEVLRQLNQAATRNDAITVFQRHEFAELPSPGFETRPHHPGSGYYGTRFLDFSVPFDQSIAQLRINRHRIEGRRGVNGRFEVTRPIRYFVDNSAPQPIRQALLEGASWWSEAFEAAGLPGAFEVAILPKGIDPLDLRYNVITWTHRATRGWSYGMSIVDPRTGEIIKGHVNLGSQRIRQDYLIAEGLLNPYIGEKNSEAQQSARAFALARLRQLAAHEVGHTLGLVHNFAASSTSAHSVMDYPFPKFKIASDGTIDLSDAYEVGIGDWDKHTILMGYGMIPSEKNAYEWMDGHARQASERGVKFISDQNVVRGGAHPIAHRWDNGQDPVAEFWHIAKVREIALAKLGSAAIRPDESRSSIQSRFVPVYLLHRYQVEAAVKSIGGVEFAYETRLSTLSSTSPTGGQKIVDDKIQRDALKAMLHTLSIKFLSLPDSLLSQLTVLVPGFSPFLEVFSGRTSDIFDPVEAASQSASITLALLFHPERLERLDQQAARDSRLLGPGEVIDKVLRDTWNRTPEKGYQAAISRGVQIQVLRRFFDLATNKQASSQARGFGINGIEAIADIAKRRVQSSQSNWKAHYRFALAQIRQLEEDHSTPWQSESLSTPPGAPIGDGCFNWMGLSGFSSD